MILSVTFSKPVKNISEILGGEYTRVKIKLLTASLAASKNENYFAEFYTAKQVFHKKMSEAELNDFIASHAGTTFKNCVQRTESEEITILANKKGKITELRKQLAISNEKLAINSKGESSLGGGVSRSKKYLLPEGVAVPFLVHLGVMTAEGKVVKSKYDKFRQINRFLEMLDDILDDVVRLRENEKNPVSENSPLNIVDFGSGKSYLTFAVQYYLTEVKKIPSAIFGLDLKKDVIAYCNTLAQKLGLKNLSFAVGDIASFGEEKHPDIIVTLHACDTAHRLCPGLCNPPESKVNSLGSVLSARNQQPAFGKIRATRFVVRASPKIRPHKRTLLRPSNRRTSSRTPGAKRLQGADTRIYRRKCNAKKPVDSRSFVRQRKNWL